MPRLKLRRTKGTWGTYEPSTDVITLNTKLNKYSQPSKNYVLQHELFHKYISLSKLDLPDIIEEISCELFSIISCKESELSFGDIILRRTLIKLYGRKIPKKKLILIAERYK